MRPSVVIAVLLLLAGVGALIALSASGGVSSGGVTIADILGKTAGEGRLRLAVQVTEYLRDFNPMEFRAIDVVEEGQTPKVDAPSILVRYRGKDLNKPEIYSHVAIEGRWDEQNNVFEAISLSTRCPSHYEDKGKPPAPMGVKQALSP